MAEQADRKPLPEGLDIPAELARRPLGSGCTLSLAWVAHSYGQCKADRSMSRKGCSPDNAACEGLFGRLKTELFYARDWRETTLEQFIELVDSYIRWYNEKRIKISLGSLSPIEYRASLGLAA